MTEDEFLALPPAQRKEFQKELKAKGLYHGPIDGLSGDGVRTALKAMDREKAEQADREANQAIEKRSAEANATLTEAEAEEKRAAAAAKTAEIARKKRYDEQASSGWGMAAQSGANLGAPAAGTALGMALGKGVNVGMDAAQNSRNKVLASTAADRVAGLTTREGAREGARLAGAMPLSNPAARTASRMLPHVGLGALSIGKGAQVLHDSDPNGEFYNRMADRAAGLGYIGVGAGLAKQGLRYAAAPGVAPDAQSIAIINSNQLRRNPSGAQGPLSRALSGQTIDAEIIPDAPERAALPPPDAPEKPVAPGTKAYMQAQAKEFGIKGTSRMTKSQLAEALGKAMSEHGARRTVAKKLPKAGGSGTAAALAGGLAYALSPDEAQAANGSTVGGRAEALTNAGIAGGGAYGVSKLAEALGPMAGKALGMTGSMMGPMAAGDMTDMSQEDLNQGRNWMARNAPALAIGPGMSQAYDMAQVPEPSPMRSVVQEQERPMPNAEALDIPNGIPPDAAQQAEMQAQAFAPNVQGRLDRMIKLGARPEQIAAFLNQAAAR